MADAEDVKERGRERFRDKQRGKKKSKKRSGSNVSSGYRLGNTSKCSFCTYCNPELAASVERRREKMDIENEIHYFLRRFIL